MGVLAAIQAAPIYGDAMATARRAAERIAEAAQKRAWLAVFPESYLPGYPDWIWRVPARASSPSAEPFFSFQRRKRLSWQPLIRCRVGDQQSEGRVEDGASSLLRESGGIPEIFEREHIRLALASMPQEYAIVLILNAAQGVPYQEVGAIVGISPTAAATRISRAKKLFREHYRHIDQAL